MEAAVRSFQLPRRGLVSRLPSLCARRAPPSTVVLRAYASRSSITNSHSIHPQTPRSPCTLPAPRLFSTMTTIQPRFAEGADTSDTRAGLDAIIQRGWALDEEGMGIKKTFYFKSYFKAVSFVNVIASQSTSKKHHATMTVRIGSVDIHWTTHQPRGLTDKDLTMAQFCEEAAQLMGAVEEGQGKKCGPGPSGA